MTTRVSVTKKDTAVTMAQRPDGYFEVAVGGYIKFMTRDEAKAHAFVRSLAPPPPRNDLTLKRAVSRV